jgi:uncharacterized protein (DUF58 family)
MASTPRVAALPLAWAERARERFLRRTPSDGTAVTLAHARIYILPSRRGLAVIGTLATMLVASLNYGLALGLVVTFLFTGLASAALLHTFRNLAGTTLRPGGAGETFAGAKLAFTLGVDPGGRERVAIELAAGGAAPKVVDVAAEAAPSVTLEVDAPRRGRVPLGRITVASSFPLGLWRGWSYVHFPLEGIAYPAPEPGAPPLPPGTRDDDAASPRGAGDAELAGLREYQRGDPLQRVAWKAVARGGGWFTKAFEGSGGGGPVSLDYAALPRALDPEARLSRLAAWVLACERAGRPYALSLPGERIAPGLGREQRRAALTALALFDAPQGEASERAAPAVARANRPDGAKRAR